MRVRRGDLAEVAFSDERPRSSLAAATQRGDLKRLGRGVYTPLVDEDPASVVRRNWVAITGRRFPGAVVTDRSARREGPDPKGFLFVSAATTGLLELPGLVVVARRGPLALGGDLPLGDGLHLASRARALLENARPSRRVKQRPARTLTAGELGDWIDQLAATDGEDRLKAWRDDARGLAPDLGATESELEVVDAAIGAALGTRPAVSSATALVARRRGLPFDQARVAAFDVLVDALEARPLAEVPALAEDEERRRFLPFYEAYFSNFIEGTEFTPSEALGIVEEGVVPSARPEDGHDILGTYRVLSDEVDLAREPGSAQELLDRLQRWHASVMEGRPAARPGEWKVAANRAGQTEFVAPDLVVGTLVAAWDRRQHLLTPSQRAVFMLFAVAEVHPFTDGNGRVARASMTAEHVAGAEGRVIVPTVCRNDYLNALRRLTRQGRPDLLFALVDRLQRFTARIDFTSERSARQQLTVVNAFVAADDAERRGIHLLLRGLTTSTTADDG